MNLHTLREPPPAWLGEALERFERQFDYPLGEGRRFRISHGRDYLPFFAAMGEATVNVAEAGGEVLGTLVRVERWLECDHATPPRRRVHYLCDLKVSPHARCTGLLAHLMWETRLQVAQSGAHACYGIVMDGTGRRPADYTGRRDIPPFQPLAQIVVLRITAAESILTPQTSIAETFAPRPACILTGGDSTLRSLMPPIRIADTAWLEDTRRGKRLWTDDGTEMLSAHLSGFRFSDPAYGAAVVRQAVHATKAAGMPAMFVAVPHSQVAALLEPLHDLQILQAPATIYGHDLAPGHDWWVDTAEI
ncbi:N-acetyltransferase [Prosthecobacter sp.]|uniref:N-acetyltransferase n=1 Tax=Prosthecobacter sp. TaxID=1965333 RepID=UPI003783156E